ncbi:MAG: hypothetical protein ABI999_08825 [Acidobacteriota bacterium]
MVNAAETAGEIRSLIDGHFEWLLVREEGRSFPLSRTEIDVEHAGEKIMLGIPDDRGFLSWRVNRFTENEGEIELDVAGAFGKKREQLRLVPRTSAKELTLEIEIARLKRSNEIAAAIAGCVENAKLVRVALAKENGRTAHIFFKDAGRQMNAVMADVTDTATPESLLATALLWQVKLDLRKTNRVGRVWIAAPSKTARNLQKLLALVKPVVCETVHFFELKESAGETNAAPLTARPMSSLWRERSKKLFLPETAEPSETARKIIDLAPAEIDIVYSRQGETLRYAGLPFARVRSLLGKEKAWFGVNKDRHLLTHESWNSLCEFLDDMADYRCAPTPNKHHEFYRSSPEAWLESILKRNIKLLDANLILSPIYSQFRTSNDKIDLLALRKDGRLVIIELKTAPSREMVFQVADYWRKIELQRRQGKLSEANLFDGREILDKPAIIYLGAPAWSFHRDFSFFARMLSKEIEMWRFELHEKWRESVKVIARTSYSEAGR